MRPMGLMQVPIHHIVDVIPVRNGLMSTTRHMLVTGLVAIACVVRGAFRWILRVDV